MWTYSIILESIAIVPQIVLLQRNGAVENITADYVVTLGAYRAFYILNWIVRLITETGYRAWTTWIFGIIQTGLYCDFFYYYAKSKMEGKQLELPA